MDFVDSEVYNILNDGAPTRWQQDRVTNKLTHSWIDVTLSKELISAMAKWKSIQLDKGSDHYQLWITLLGK